MNKCLALFISCKRGNDKRRCNWMKKIIAFILSIFCFSFLSGCGASPTLDKLKFEISPDETYYIVSAANTEISGEVVIPSTYKGLPVKSIANLAFSECLSLTSISIPDSVTYIGMGAFNMCDSLLGNKYDNAYYLGNKKNPYLALFSVTGTETTSCNINAKCKIICPYAFALSSIVSITIPDNVTSIGKNAFYLCYSLESVKIGNGVISIDDEVFNDCSNLESIIIGNGVTSISQYAFRGCKSLTSIGFEGTKEQWNDIIKENSWNKDTHTRVINCSDGDVSIYE